MKDDNTQDSPQEKTLVEHIADLEEKAALDLVENRLHNGDDPLQIVEECQEGLRLVGVRYEQQQYYLSGLIMAGEIFREVIEIVQPVIEETYNGNDTGRILLGTAQGDIHDIGKNNLSLLLRCHGFTVIDLGVDVDPANFYQEALEIKPDVIGLSGLLTSSFDSMAETIRLIRSSKDNDLREVPILIGGSQVNEEVCKYVGADYWLTDAMQGVRLCQELLQKV